LALGSNLGDRLATLVAAVRALAGAGMKVIACSAVYEPEAVARSPQPAYLNAVVAVRTELSPAAVLAAALGIERRFGRVRPPGGEPAPRTLDIDLLLHGRTTLKESGLIVPHPRLLDRPFVRIPLADVAEANLVHPETGEGLASAADDPDVRRVLAASDMAALACTREEGLVAVN